MNRIFLQLSKKITIPNHVDVSALALSQHGWIACGCENGMLKIFKLETEATSTINISSNQTLDGHCSRITHLSWNDQFRKLASSDENGLIIVWYLHEDKTWYEEMINNRNKSAVCVLQWSIDGKSIVIGYDDGVVTVGSVEGTRIWSKNVGSKLISGHWIQSEVYLLTDSGSILSFDRGTQIKKWAISEILSTDEMGYQAESMHYPICSENRVATIVIVTKCGAIFFFRQPFLSYAFVVNTGLNEIVCSWNESGTILAVGGALLPNETSESRVVVKCYDIEGKEISCLYFPGEGAIRRILWDGSRGLICSIGPNIFFAVINYDYLWTRIGSTVVFASLKKSAGSSWTDVKFWNSETNEYYFVMKSYLIRGIVSGDYRVSLIHHEESSMNKCIVHLCDEVGGTVEIKRFDVRPLCFAMDNENLVLCDGKQLQLWNYSSLDDSEKELKYEVDDTSSGNIVALTISPTGEVITARVNGLIEIIDMKSFFSKQVLKVDTSVPPSIISLNQQPPRMFLFNSLSTLFVFDTSEKDSAKLIFRKNNCFDIMWEKSKTDTFALKDKEKINVYHDGNSKPKILDAKHGFSFFSFEGALMQMNIPYLCSNDSPYSLDTMFEKHPKS